MLDLLQYYFWVLCNGMKTRFRMVMIAHPGPGIGFHKRFMWQIIIILPTMGNWLPDFEQKLVTHAGSLFVWVSIVMEYLRNKTTDPVAALEDLLDPDASRDDMPAEEKLDILYSAILSKCNWKDKTFKYDYPIVMGAIVTVKSSLSM